MRPGRVELYKDAGKRWRWRFVGRGGHVLADSGQSYANRGDCLRGALAVTRPDTPVYEVKT